MPRVLVRHIEEPKIYSCATCETHLCTEGRVHSREFHTQNGRGYLVENVINVTNGPSNERTLRTGLHTCEDVYCVKCSTMVGWEYKWAFEEEQKYKVGKFVLEEVKIAKYHWESD